MKTKAVPALIMLTAGFIDCIFSIYCHLSLWRFTWQLLLVLILFYVLGCVVQVILDKNFAGMDQEEAEPETEEDQEEAAASNGEAEEQQQNDTGEGDE